MTSPTLSWKRSRLRPRTVSMVSLIEILVSMIYEAAGADTVQEGGDGYQDKGNE